MSLEVKKSIKRYIPKIILWLVIILAGLAVIKLALWEKHYYDEKEGSERVTAGVVGDLDRETVSDEEVTEKQVSEYTVDPDKPRYMSIPKLGIKKARIFAVGVNSKGQMQTPKTNYDVAWYNKSATPGSGKTSIFNGHNGGPNSYGVFKKLNTLVSGDEIMIEMGDGKTYTYRVYDNFEVKLSEANEKMHMLQTTPVEGQESISIITCIGEYSLKQKTYLSRQFLRATRTN